MSRDWTPRKTYEIEQNNIKNGNGSLWDFIKNTSWIIDGKTFPLCPPECLENRKKYPVLGRFYDRFDQLYDSLFEIPGGMEFLAEQEKRLADYISSGREDVTTPLFRWFEGKLDTSFYYRERNDELLYEHLLAEARLHAKHHDKPSLQEQIRDAKLQADADVASSVISFNTLDR